MVKISEVEKFLNKENATNSTYEYIDISIMDNMLERFVVPQHKGYRDGKNFVLNGTSPIYTTIDQTKRAFPKTDSNDNDCIVAIMPSMSSDSLSDNNSTYVSNLQDTYLENPFREIRDIMNEDRVNSARILFPYIRSDHWCTGEIFLSREDNKFDIGVYIHNPFGDKDNNEELLTEDQMSTMREAIKNTIESLFGNDLIISINNYASAYTQRQNSEDHTSCGIITILDIEKLVMGESLDMEKPYNNNVVEQRYIIANNLLDESLKEIDKIESEQFFTNEEKAAARTAIEDKTHALLEAICGKNQIQRSIFGKIGDSIKNTIPVGSIHHMGSTCLTGAVNFKNYIGIKINNSVDSICDKARKFVYMLEDEIRDKPVLFAILACSTKSVFDIYNNEDKMLHNKSFILEGIKNFTGYNIEDSAPFTLSDALDDKSYLPAFIGGMVACSVLGYFTGKVVNEVKNKISNNLPSMNILGKIESVCGGLTR